VHPLLESAQALVHIRERARKPFVGKDIQGSVFFEGLHGFFAASIA
jgi:hypothetical protein